MLGKKQTKKKRLIPHTITESIPYERISSTGIFELEEGYFSRIWKLPTLNFISRSEEKQEELAGIYTRFLDTLSADVQIQITLRNRRIREEAFRQAAWLPMKEDGLDGFRNEYNQMLLTKAQEAKSGLETVVYLTVSLEAISLLEAKERFFQMEKSLTGCMLQLGAEAVHPLSMVESLDLLHEIYEDASNLPSVYQKREGEDGTVQESFTLQSLAAQGITTKELIAPEVLAFYPDCAQVGPAYTKSYYINHYPTFLKASFLSTLTGIPQRLSVSVCLRPIEQAQALRLVRDKAVNIKSEVIFAEKDAAKNQIYGDVAVPTYLKEANVDVEELLHQMTRKNVRLYDVAVLVTLTADTKEELQRCEKALKAAVSGELCAVGSLYFMQEKGFAATLPIGRNELRVWRIMTSDTLKVLIPFDGKRLFHPDGTYYGINPVRRELILYDRLRQMNRNACILGTSGSGKSFAAKRELLRTILGTDDEVYIIDPEREYVKMAEELNGTVVKLASGSGIHINPFDINLGNEDEMGDPVKIKADFIETLCEIMIGVRYGLSPIEKSIIGRVVLNIYQSHIEELKREGTMQNMETAPTMADFYEELCLQPHPEAAGLALALERFVTGPQDMFAYRTNIDIQNRFIVYDIKDIGPSLKESGLQITLDHIWNRMIENHAKGKRTWIYVDEFYILMKNRSAAEYISQIWKRARKWNGIPTAVTQNIEDMLKSEEARAIINNSSLVVLLGQSAMDHHQLSSLYGLSEKEQEDLKLARPGSGLLRIGEDTVSMIDDFPKDTGLYRIMTTNPNEPIQKTGGIE